jgi:hypothetical protein
VLALRIRGARSDHSATKVSNSGVIASTYSSIDTSIFYKSILDKSGGIKATASKKMHPQPAQPAFLL